MRHRCARKHSVGGYWLGCDRPHWVVWLLTVSCYSHLSQTASFRLVNVQHCVGLSSAANTRPHLMWAIKSGCGARRVHLLIASYHATKWHAKCSRRSHFRCALWWADDVPSHKTLKSSLNVFSSRLLTLSESPLLRGARDLSFACFPSVLVSSWWGLDFRNTLKERGSCVFCWRQAEKKGVDSSRCSSVGFILHLFLRLGMCT